MEPVSVRLARGGDDGTAKAHLRGDAQDTLDVVLGAHGTQTGRRASRCADTNGTGNGKPEWETPRTVSWDASLMHMRHFIAR